jgi:DNA gyrase/topoisomerase IV subunit B
MGAGKQITIDISDQGHVVIRDYGRGIPLGKIVDCVSVINTGAKYNTDVFQFSVGLNGVGTKAVNALSREFTATAYREGKFATASFEEGTLVSEDQGDTTEKNGTEIAFYPSPDIFKDFVFRKETIKKRLWRYAYLNAGLKLKYDSETFYSKNGLLDLLANEVGDTNLYKPLHYKDDTLEFTFTHINGFGENYFSFVNGTYTNEGGTHLSAFREGILKGVNEFSGKKFAGEDVREGIVGTVAVKVKEPIFESQTKNKLGNTEIRTAIVNRVKDFVCDYLYKHTDIAEILLQKVGQNARVRKELQHVRKEAKAKSRKVAIRVPQLKDCKYHPAKGKPSKPGRENMIFITEGQSASGSIVSARDPMTQAVFSLKGKPLNVYGQSMALLYKNDELYNMMRALNIEESIAALRYDKIILATDADVDGLHIRNLLLTFFLHYFENLVKRGHVYILETPIFRVRNKKDARYCYSEREKKAAEKNLRGRGRARLQVEVTRFKGLGEISPPEFKQFIGSDMRIKQVNIDKLSEVPELLSFYMGKNTPLRKGYIMEHLARAVEQVI